MIKPRDIDRAVATLVMEMENDETVPCYSTDIGDAWDVHLRMADDDKLCWAYAEAFVRLSAAQDNYVALLGEDVFKNLSPANICRAALATKALVMEFDEDDLPTDVGDLVAHVRASFPRGGDRHD